MKPIGPLEIPAGQTVTLKPGTMHVMLMKLRMPLKRGATFSLVLRFEGKGLIKIQTPIYGPGASGPH